MKMFELDLLLNKEELKSYSSTALAFVGDAVFALAVKTHVTKEVNAKSGKLHSIANAYLNAVKQSELLSTLSEELTEEEQAVVNRGRNAYTKNKPKSTDKGQYQNATALEALIGYLYLSGQTDRLEFVLNKVISEVRL